MGYNSVVLILNDCLNEIKKDKEFGDKVDDAVMRLHNGNQVDINSGCCVNAATAISCQHADVTQIIAVGGNCATVLANLWGNHHTEEGRVFLLKSLADSMGYRVVKKAAKGDK